MSIIATMNSLNYVTGAWSIWGQTANKLEESYHNTMT